MRNFWLSVYLGLIFLAISCAPKKWIPAYRTPEETFETWRRAASELNFSVLMDTYVESAKPQIRKQIEETSSNGLQAMKDETRRTQFRIEKIVYENDRAYVRVVRKLNHTEEIEILTMSKELGSWKLMP